jgi:hypothetical protein
MTAAVWQHIWQHPVEAIAAAGPAAAAAGPAAGAALQSTRLGGAGMAGVGSIRCCDELCGSWQQPVAVSQGPFL